MTARVHRAHLARRRAGRRVKAALGGGGRHFAARRRPARGLPFGTRARPKIFDGARTRFPETIPDPLQTLQRWGETC
jgi:hypothetical protein